MILQKIRFSLLCLLLVGGGAAHAQNLPPYAGTRCADFGTQLEAQWHYVMGTAPASLDNDRNGWVCEYLTTTIRQDGNRIYSNQAIRGSEVYRLEVWRVHTNDVYLRIRSNKGLDFTTRSFPSDPAAREHMRTYYQNLLN